MTVESLEALMLTRRNLLFGGLIAGIAGMIPRGHATLRGPQEFEVTRTEAEWRKLLTPDQFAVLRKEGTQRAYTSPLLHQKCKGVFACAGCNLDLFASATKYESGTGWPSFWKPLDNAV